jgi:hypothetical protein
LERGRGRSKPSREKGREVERQRRVVEELIEIEKEEEEEL